MAERVYVALDLETTGLDARMDAIIEIGAVRFALGGEAEPSRCRVVDRFVSLVNPLRPIPLRIQQLTGIRDADVAAAPSLEKVIPELRAFVTPDVAAVMAHNAAFDMGFLRAAGVDFHRPIQDTFELASILLPGMASYSLGELCRKLGIALPEAHRALDDALASANLFALTIAQLQATPAWILNILMACGRETDWPLLRLVEEHCQLDAGYTDALAFTPTWSDDPRLDVPDGLRHDSAELLQTIDAAQVELMFGADGIYHRLLGAGYEQRSGQQAMAGSVLNALNRGDHLLIEAGTGTGKSLAYLTPAALWSATNARRVVVATNTLALQDQLLEKDIPQVVAALAEEGAAFRAMQLKGRGNYLCTRRLHAWYHNRRLSWIELRVLAKVLVWLLETETGDVSELFLPSAPERQIWSRLCSDAATCTAQRCYSARDAHGGQHVDFFLRARQQAEAAHVLVVNHALLLSDLATGGRLLPPFSHLVVDEAHRLEDAATDQLSYRVDWEELRAGLERWRASGDLYQAVLSGATRQGDAECQDRLREVEFAAGEAATALAGFAGSLLAFARSQDSLRGDFRYTQRLSLDSRVRTQPAWSEMELDWDNAGSDVRRAESVLDALIQHLAAHRWWLAEPGLTVLQDIQGMRRQLVEALSWLDRIIFQAPVTGESEIVTWMEVNESLTEATLVAAPLFVGETLERELVHRKRSVIFTGATLRTGSGFGFIRDRLGLWDVAACTVESPFDYERNTLLYLPRDLPEPNHSSCQQAVEQAIIHAAVASDGATLALFTSYAQLRMTAEAIRAPLDKLGITVLQHGTSSRQRLLREYRSAERAVLLGTRSFWEGIDLPGDELRCLLIVRLPFAVPTDPLVAARSAEADNAFRDYTLPDAILRFRQGFGRLIRRSTDRGVVVLLDSRVWRKEYGQSFLESLPKCTTRHAPLANLEHEIAHWLGPARGANGSEAAPES